MSSTRSFVVMKWSRDSVNQEPHKAYTSGHVNHLFEMLQATQTTAVKLYCLTDRDDGLHKDVRAISIPNEVLNVIHTFGRQFGKLYLFSKQFRNAIDDKFIYCDLDTAIVGDFSGEYGSDDEVTIMRGKYGDDLRRMINLHGNNFSSAPYLAIVRNTLRAGAAVDLTRYMKLSAKKRCVFNSSFLVIGRHQSEDLWETFDPRVAHDLIEERAILGSDQAWLQVKKYDTARVVGPEQGFYYKREIDKLVRWRRPLPKNLKMVIFAGKSKPWSRDMQSKRWVEQLYGRQVGS